MAYALSLRSTQWPLTSPEGQRRVAVEHVATGPKRSVLANDEFIESIEMPIVDGWQGYSKIGTRNAMVISVAGVAVVLSAVLKFVSHCSRICWSHCHAG